MVQETGWLVLVFSLLIALLSYQKGQRVLYFISLRTGATAVVGACV